MGCHFGFESAVEGYDADDCEDRVDGLDDSDPDVCEFRAVRRLAVDARGLGDYCDEGRDCVAENVLENSDPYRLQARLLQALLEIYISRKRTYVEPLQAPSPSRFWDALPTLPFEIMVEILSSRFAWRHEVDEEHKNGD